MSTSAVKWNFMIKKLGIIKALPNKIFGSLKLKKFSNKGLIQKSAHLGKLIWMWLIHK